ncbi:MAG TPA: CsgG/HfaB family protein [Spirochaetota bacterium]|nr:CsgG/HfaB family protein [Spirochaetota bacterium]
MSGSISRTAVRCWCAALSIAALLHAGAWNAHAAPLVVPPGARLALAGIQGTKVDASTAAFYFELVATEWRNTGVFTLIDPALSGRRLAAAGITIAHHGVEPKDAVAAGKALGAQYILTGRVQAFAGKHHVFVKLYDATSGRLVLSQVCIGKHYKEMMAGIHRFIKSGTPAAVIDEKAWKAGRGTVAAGRSAAVMDVDSSPGDRELARAIQMMLRDEVVKSNLFAVVEREKLEKLVQEVELAQAGLLKGDARTPADGSSRLKAAGYMLFGSYARIDDTGVFSFRVVNVGTGIVEYSDRAFGAKARELSGEIRRIVSDLKTNH